MKRRERLLKRKLQIEELMHPLSSEWARITRDLYQIKHNAERKRKTVQL